MTDTLALNIMPGMSINPSLLKRLQTEGLITLSQAADLLGTTPVRIAALIKAGTLQGFVSPLDRRLKLVRQSDVEALGAIQPMVQESPKKKSPK